MDLLTSFFDFGMWQNLFAEGVGIVVTVVVIDTLYRQRQLKQQELATSRLCTHVQSENDYIARIFGIYIYQLNTASGWTGAQYFRWWVRLNEYLRAYARSLDRLVDVYSIPADYWYVEYVGGHSRALDTKLTVVEEALSWLVACNEEVREKADRLSWRMAWRTIASDTSVDLGALNDQLQNIQDSLDGMSRMIKLQKLRTITFWWVLFHDSLPADGVKAIVRLYEKY